MKNAALTVLRVFLGVIFTVSGGLKLLEPSQQFLETILGFEIIGGAPARFLSVALPWTELIFGVFLVLGLWTEAATAILWVMNSVFILALTSVLVRGLPMDECGCLGKKFSLPVPGALLLDVVFWAAFFFLWTQRRRHSQWSLDKLFR